jgi:hypothetical protein
MKSNQNITIVSRENYILAPQATRHFGSSPQTTKKFQKEPFCRNIPIIHLSCAIFQLKREMGCGLPPPSWPMGWLSHTKSGLGVAESPPWSLGVVWSSPMIKMGVAPVWLEGRFGYSQGQTLTFSRVRSLVQVQNDPTAPSKRIEEASDSFMHALLGRPPQYFFFSFYF